MMAAKKWITGAAGLRLPANCAAGGVAFGRGAQETAAHVLRARIVHPGSRYSARHYS
jgi:hypothetical protein